MCTAVPLGRPLGLKFSGERATQKVFQEMHMFVSFTDFYIHRIWMCLYPWNYGNYEVGSQFLLRNDFLNYSISSKCSAILTTHASNLNMIT